MGFERFQHIGNVTTNYSQKASEYITHQYQEARRRDPSFSSESKLDLPNLPRFQYVEPRLSFKYSNALPYILLMLAFFLAPLFLYLNAFITKKGLLRLSFAILFACVFSIDLFCRLC